MVFLSEMPLPLRGVGDRRVLVSRLALRVDRREHDAPSARPHHAVHFAHRAAVVVDMLENMVAEYHVELAVGKRNPLNVHLDLRQRGLQIGRHVIERRQLLETLQETTLGRDMQQTAGVSKKAVSFFR